MQQILDLIAYYTLDEPWWAIVVFALVLMHVVREFVLDQKTRAEFQFQTESEADHGQY